MRRREFLTPSLAKRGKEAKSVSDCLGEFFARGLFPEPAELLPRKDPRQEDQIKWINLPASGTLEGSLFSDGSSVNPKTPQLRRAGWALLQADRLGNTVVAVFGPVPLAVCPNQTAPEAEDFSASMFVVLGAPPFECRIDCKGTLQRAAKSAKATLRARDPRAHLWRRYLAGCGGEEVSLLKTKAHATSEQIREGVTTEWEWKANNAVYVYTRWQNKGQRCAS